MAEKSLMDSLSELEKAVAVAKEKESKRDQLAEQLTFASKEYSDAVEKVLGLKSSLNDRLGNLFPDQGARVKVS